MATRNIVPRENNEGSLGTTLKRWLSGFFKWLDISEYIDFTPNGASYKEGRVFYDSNEKTLSLYNDNSEITHNLGQEHLARVKNISGADIENGKVVLLSGGDGTGFPTVELAKADTEDNSSIFGMTTTHIPDGEYGYVCLCGKIHGLDTSSFASGDLVYLSPTEAGGITNEKPAIVTIIGRIVKSHDSEGIIYIYSKELGQISADMLKAVYDIDDDGIVDKAENIDDGEGNSSSAADVKDAVTKKHDALGQFNQSIAAEINGLSNKVTPVDNDVILGEDSAAGTPFSKIRLLWSNIKATLKTYFDTLYDAIGAASSAISAHLSAYDHTKIHTQNTDTKLDEGGANEVSASDIVKKSGSLTQITTRNHSDLQNKNLETDIKHVTDNQKDGLDNANSPSSSNPLITEEDVEYYYAESLGESSTTSTYPTYINKLTLSIPTPVAGDYILEWSYDMANSDDARGNWSRVRDGITTFHESNLNVGVSYADSGWRPYSGFKKITLSGSAVNFYIDFCRATLETAYIKNAKLLLRRIV